jgi:hypothetical protein
MRSSQKNGVIDATRPNATARCQEQQARRPPLMRKGVSFDLEASQDWTTQDSSLTSNLLLMVPGTIRNCPGAVEKGRLQLNHMFVGNSDGPIEIILFEWDLHNVCAFGMHTTKHYILTSQSSPSFHQSYRFSSLQLL